MPPSNSLHSSNAATIINNAIEGTTLSIIAFLLLLSLVSLYRIFQLRHKSHSSQHLKIFNNLWTVRLLLVLFISGWTVNELLCLPYFRETLLLTFLNQPNLCKLHVVLSLGFLEPGFLITLLYLINISIKNKGQQGEKCCVIFVIVMSLPTLFLQTILLFYTPWKGRLPSVMTQSSLLSSAGTICTYPLLSCILFCGFGIVYSMGLLLACWRVGSLVINKTIRVRINMLGVTVMSALLVQALFLGAESLWTVTEIGSGGVFVSVAVCAVVGEVVLVLKPVMEALETEQIDHECIMLLT